MVCHVRNAIGTVVVLLLRPDFYSFLLLSQSYTPHLNFNGRSTTNSYATTGSARTSVPLRRHHPWLQQNTTTTDDATDPMTSPPPPFIAIITEPDACDSDERYDTTMNALYQAISTNHVDLISIRLARNTNATLFKITDSVTNAFDDDDDDDEEAKFQSRYIRMIRQLREWSCGTTTTTTTKTTFRIVVSSGPYMELGLRQCVDGVHFKERHQSEIPLVRQLYRKLLELHDESMLTTTTIDDNSGSTEYKERNRNPELLVGTSVHSISSAIDAYTNYRPDYLFVGTCYPTQSHPTKRIIDLEGPLLPSQTCDALRQYISTTASKEQQQYRPLVLGIGGIDERNCGFVVKPPTVTDQQAPPPNTTTDNTTTTVYTGMCDGIAIIRSVLQSSEPATTMLSMYDIMVDAQNDLSKNERLTDEK